MNILYILKLYNYYLFNEFKFFNIKNKAIYFKANF